MEKGIEGQEVTPAAKLMQEIRRTYNEMIEKSTGPDIAFMTGTSFRELFGQEAYKQGLRDGWIKWIGGDAIKLSKHMEVIFKPCTDEPSSKLS